ncbi:hypothetical protein [Sebaldella termitidis]|uniref:hypothetical protein n=1 Tax=Sebaldella termitidis TaxID=826 RepID=UPI003EBCECEF
MVKLDNVSFECHIGLSFSGKGIDYLFFGILTKAPNWFLVILFGLIMGAVYYFVFKFAILKWNLLTPGRGDEEVAESLGSSTADVSGNINGDEYFCIRRTGKYDGY